MAAAWDLPQQHFGSMRSGRWVVIITGHIPEQAIIPMQYQQPLMWAQIRLKAILPVADLAEAAQGRAVNYTSSGLHHGKK